MDAPCLMGVCKGGKCTLEPAPKGKSCGASLTCDGEGNCLGDKGYDVRPSNKTCLAFEHPATDTTVKLESFAPKLSFPNLLWMLQAPGDTDRFFVVEKGGGIRSFVGSNPSSFSTVADLKGRIDAGPNEAGLLGMAFHPKFLQNGHVFLSFTDHGPKGLRSVVARYTSTDGGKTIPLSSEKIILTQDQPYGNHNGGMIAFGLDGFLYLGLGDGGSAGDPLNAGQTLTTLLGKMIRIDVDGGDPYAIPEDNPFAKGGGLPEIFAWGLRNPWRFSFDRATGDLWAGDVGQGKWEEIDLIKLGGNYGWRTMEGTACYHPATGCNKAGLILPVVEYPHSQGVSVTGGYVYRGKAIPGLVGRYLYGDFGSGRIWTIQEDPVTGQPSGKELLQSGLNISSFAEDNAGELYVLHYTGGTIHKLVPADTPKPSNFPDKLSATGCFETTDPTKPTEGLIPYEINAPFWSDGAQKKRWFAIPEGATIAINAAGDFDLPVGSVVAKEFTLGGKRIETRLLVRHQDGDWAGYSYEWNDAQTDATYVPGGKTKVVDGQVWLYPSSAQCLRCHTEKAGRTLGLELAQLNRTASYPSGITAHQLSTFEKIGLLATPLSAPVEQLPRLPDPFGAGPLQDRARSYLHTNCAFCHLPGGTGLGDADYRYSTPFSSMKVCGVAPTQGDLGVAGAQVIAPGKPELSVLSLRVRSLDIRRMPPLGSTVVDTQGAALLDAFIASLTSCPLLCMPLRGGNATSRDRNLVPSAGGLTLACHGSPHPPWSPGHGACSHGLQSE
ncbi:MAG: PQQ-dependent sugar dehydrogenase [Myxococcales bacterium]|nr:PQQ-dependent sugar dehydrogenase [Polyangiaceae bacterium]MDW8248029.1 PQQ-dependent sugar dehydrogenase [Myxococcales bacterium]